jgi:hypothetical protein
MGSDFCRPGYMRRPFSVPHRPLRLLGAFPRQPRAGKTPPVSAGPVVMGRGLWSQFGHSVHRRPSRSQHRPILSTGIWRAVVLLSWPAARVRGHPTLPRSRRSGGGGLLQLAFGALDRPDGGNASNPHGLRDLCAVHQPDRHVAAGVMAKQCRSCRQR